MLMLLRHLGFTQISLRKFINSWSRMQPSNHDYKDAMRKLNSLQSNRASISQIKTNIQLGQRCSNLEDMERYLQRAGLAAAELHELGARVVHVAGTKGKGTTCALCESVVRAHGVRTGLFTSPHLVSVRERIRLDGRPIAEPLFLRHFYAVYEALLGSRRDDADMPPYFAFLTVLALCVFVRERVQLCVLEVGIGGAHDYTNVLRRVPLVGIASLGLEHTAILGGTLAQVAAAKAGIMKPGCVAYTVRQEAAAMRVLRATARRTPCALLLAPPCARYAWEGGAPPAAVGQAPPAVRRNASLALQLALAWLRAHAPCPAALPPPLVVSPAPPALLTRGAAAAQVARRVGTRAARALDACVWPGRFHTVRAWPTARAGPARVDARPPAFYLDGAHTPPSVAICTHWFRARSRSNRNMLMFTTTGDRDPAPMLEILSRISFEAAFFVVPVAKKHTSETDDNFSHLEDKEKLTRCEKHALLWNAMQHHENCKIFVCECVTSALNLMHDQFVMDDSVSVLVTGSLHLVGAAIALLDPDSVNL